MAGGIPDPLIISSAQGELTIRFADESVSVDGVGVPLTPTERDIILCLARNYGNAVSVDDLVAQVWGDWFGGRGHLNVHMHHLRRKLGPLGSLIVTRRGMGYLLEPPARGLGLPSPWPGDRRAMLDILQADAFARGVVWLFVERDFTIAWVSDSITEMLGSSPDEVMEREPRDFIVTDDVPAFLAQFPAMHGAPRVQFDTEVRHKDGSWVPIRIHANVFYAADGSRLAGIGEWSLRTEPSGLSAVTDC